MAAAVEHVQEEEGACHYPSSSSFAAGAKIPRRRQVEEEAALPCHRHQVEGEESHCSWFVVVAVAAVPPLAEEGAWSSSFFRCGDRRSAGAGVLIMNFN